MSAELSGLFSDAVKFGDSGEITQSYPGFAEDEIEYPRSTRPRGLSLRSLTISERSNRFWSWLQKRQQIYFLTVATDLSGQPPQITPPAEVSSKAIYEIRRGEELSFTLGDGLPVFTPRTLVGGLVVYVIISEADRGIQHVGEVIKKVHEDLNANDGDFVKKIKALVTNPTKTLADEALGVVSAALQPLGTVLAMNKDEHLGAVSGVLRADSAWDGKLTQRWPGGQVEFNEV